jgi:predicted metal-dependent hydrolase
VNPEIACWFEEEYRVLRPRAPMPAIEVRFYRFTSLNTTIRLREGGIKVRLSDLLEGAPESVLRAIAHILIAKLYRKQIEPAYATRYRRFAASEPVMRQTERIRQSRGRKRISSAKGEQYDLDEVFEALNIRFFHGLLGRPQLTWSEHRAKRLLGHYDAAHNTIMVSRVFDRRNTPRYAIEYLMYHEMLHLKHPVKTRNGRRCVHSREFQAEENLFPELDKAKAYLKTL